MLEFWNNLTPVQKFTAIGMVAVLLAAIFGYQFPNGVADAWNTLLEFVESGS